MWVHLSLGRQVKATSSFLPVAVPTPHRYCKQLVHRCCTSPKQEDNSENVEGLLPEDDYEVPGTYRDAMSANTQLGKAVRDACEELDTLSALERETLNEAEELLKKVGFKGSLFDNKG